MFKKIRRFFSWKSEEEEALVKVCDSLKNAIAEMDRAIADMSEEMAKNAPQPMPRVEYLCLYCEKEMGTRAAIGNTDKVDRVYTVCRGCREQERSKHVGGAR